MKRLLSALLLTSASAIALAEPPVYDVVNLQADARITVPNDLMQATLFVERDNRNPSELAAEITRTINQATKAAQAFRGVKVSTGSQSSWPVHDPKGKVIAWRSRAELRLESRDFDAAANAIAQMQNGMQLGHIAFALAPETAEASENALIEKAIAAFRARADVMAKSFGAKSWRVMNVNVGSGRDMPPMPYMRGMPMKAMAEVAMPVQDVQGGDSQITVNVNGAIQLQP
jgi:predicted secreted protein